jgi:hypothetical protein
MKNEDVALHREVTAEGYLDVAIQHDGKKVTLKQEGLTKKIMSALGLDSKMSIPVDTPAVKTALGCNVEGQYASGSINYASVCRKPPRYVPYKGTYVPYNGTYGASDQGQMLDV